VQSAFRQRLHERSASKRQRGEAPGFGGSVSPPRWLHGSAELDLVSSPVVQRELDLRLQGLLDDLGGAQDGAEPSLAAPQQSPAAASPQLGAPARPGQGTPVWPGLRRAAAHRQTPVHAQRQPASPLLTAVSQSVGARPAAPARAPSAAAAAAAAAPAAGGIQADDDLLQAHLHHQMLRATLPLSSARRVRGGRQAAGRGGGGGGGAERTPAGPPRRNPMFDILPGPGATPRQGSAAAGTAASHTGGMRSARGGAAPERPSRFRQPELSSPRRGRAYFSIKPVSPPAAGAMQPPQAQGVRQLLQGRRRPLLEEGIDSADAGPDEQQQAAAAAAAAAEPGGGWMTPRARAPLAPGDATPAPGPGSDAPPPSGPRPTGSKPSVQRQFLASLPAATAAPLTAARPRAAPAGGLEGRLAAALAAEKARAAPRAAPGAPAPPPQGSATLTVVRREVQASVTACLCRCDPGGPLGGGAGGGGGWVVALFQGRAARELSLCEGDEVAVAAPHRLLQAPRGGAPPVLLCHAATQHATVHYGGA
jgi:hypothetical protein